MLEYAWTLRSAAIKIANGFCGPRIKTVTKQDMVHENKETYFA
jgi:hypothetical protein